MQGRAWGTARGPSSSRASTLPAQRCAQTRCQAARSWAWRHVQAPRSLEVPGDGSLCTAYRWTPPGAVTAGGMIWVARLAYLNVCLTCTTPLNWKLGDDGIGMPSRTIALIRKAGRSARALGVGWKRGSHGNRGGRWFHPATDAAWVQITQHYSSILLPVV